MEKAELEARVADLEREAQFLRDTIDGQSKESPTLGCPRCKSCGRDGTEAATLREVCLRLVLEAQRHQVKLEATVEAMRERVADADKVLVRQFQQDYAERAEDAPELPVPPVCFSDPKASEAIRFWRCADGSNALMVRTSVFENPFQWGMVLADILRYISQCSEKNDLHYEDEDGNSVKATYEQIFEHMLAGFQAEIEDPTDEPGHWEPDA